MNTKADGQKTYISVCIAAVLAIIGYNLVMEKYSGIKTFIVFCAIMGITFVCVRGLLELIKLKDYFYTVFCLIGSVGLTGLLILGWYKDMQVFDSPARNYIWHKYSIILVALVLILITGLFQRYFRENNVQKITLAAAAIGMAGLGAYLNLYTEYLSIDYYHGSALYNSVYNVMHGAPYTATSNSVYGNYAIFFWLPMKILGKGEYFDFSRLWSVITGICILGGSYAIYHVVEKKSVKLLCMLVLPVPLILFYGNYWQNWPLRILGATLLLVWICFCTYSYHPEHEKKHRLVASLGAYFILVFSIMWNKETGFICLLAYVIYDWFKYFTLKETPVKNLVRQMLRTLFFASAVFGAWCGVGCYNFIVSGQWISWKTFLFPLVGKRYMEIIAYTQEAVVEEQIHKVRLTIQIWPWMLNALLFLGIGCYSLVKRIRGDRSEKYNLYVLVAVLGLGLMTYFINRQAYGNLITQYIEAVIGIGIVASSSEERTGSRVVIGLSSLVLIALLSGEILQIGSRLYMKEEQTVSQRTILDIRDRIQMDAEKDTYGIGVCVPEMYSILGWDKRNYTTDCADISADIDAYYQIMDNLYQDLENEDAVITDQGVFLDAGQTELYDYLEENFYIEHLYTYMRPYVWDPSQWDNEIHFYLWKRKAQ